MKLVQLTHKYINVPTFNMPYSVFLNLKASEVEVYEVEYLN